jgi:hypothetical protein
MNILSRISISFLAIALVLGGLALPLAASAAALVPVINTPANGSTVVVGQAINFSGSVTGGTPPLVPLWYFGDNTTAPGNSFTKTYTQAGNKTVYFNVVDSVGNRATATINLIVNAVSDTTAPTTPTIIDSSHDENTSSTDTSVDISWTASTDDGGLAGYSYLWDNNPTTVPDNTVDGTGTSLTQTLTPGIWYFHIKALDTAGNASGVTHYGPITITTVTNPDPLTITNISVTGVTKNSATITWTTNRVADSRIIYDTVSHPDISGEVAPNYGYANSTETSDSVTKVTTHTVTVTGLTANTKYYFRVISQE